MADVEGPMDVGEGQGGEPSGGASPKPSMAAPGMVVEEFDGADAGTAGAATAAPASGRAGTAIDRDGDDDVTAASVVRTPATVVADRESDGGGALPAASATVGPDVEAPPQTNNLIESRLGMNGFNLVNLAKVPQIALEWKDLVFTAEIEKKKVYKHDATVTPSADGKKFTKTILGGVSGFARPGEMLAVLGAIGAGKTTLLNVLSRRIRKNTGSVTINGQPVTDDYASLVSFIQQDDIFFGNLTVKQHLMYQARLRTEYHGDPVEAERYVDDLITKLGLRKARHNMIGSVQQNLARGISGGERKRLAFASEIMANPSLILVDEPTTGLDAWMADGVMSTLKGIANAGRTVIATIHQPSSDVWSMFDRVMFLCDGRVAFFGERDAALAYFSRLGYQCPEYSNPPDFMIKVLAPVAHHAADAKKYEEELDNELVRLNDIKRTWELTAKETNAESMPQDEHNAWAQQQVKPHSKYRTSWLEQTVTLTSRAMISEVKDRLLFRARMFQTLILSLLMGLIYLRVDNGQSNVQDRNGSMYFMMMNQATMGMFGVLQTFSFERVVFQREYENGSYKVSAYFIAKTIASLIPQIFFPCLFITIQYWMVGYRSDEYAVTGWLWCMLIVFWVSQAATGTGYLIAMATPNVTVGLVIAPLVLLPLSIFGGLMINVDSIPVYFIWLQVLSFFKYGYSALSGVIWEHATVNCPPAPARCPFPNGDAVLNFLGFSIEDRALDIIILVVLAVGTRALAFILLWWSTRRLQNED